jgi:hypothetical protein
MASVQIWHIKHFDDDQQIENLPDLEKFRGVYSFLQDQEEPFRTELNHTTMSLSAWYGIEAADGFTASLTNDYRSFIDEWSSYDEGRLRLNTKFTISQEPTRDDQVEVYRDPNTEWRVYLNPSHGPRAWLEHSAAKIEFGADTGFTPTGCGGEGTIEYTRTSDDTVRVRALAPCDSYLVVADPYYPGWEATNNGKPTAVFRAYKGVRAVMLSEGENVVEFSYRPSSVYVGAGLSSLGFLMCFGATGVLLRRRRQTAA